MARPAAACNSGRPRTVYASEEDGMRRRLATLFVDIAGSTGLVLRHPPETVLGVVQCFAERVTHIALAHRGKVKDFEGDGVLLYFESAVDAAEAAFAIHAALERERCESGCGRGPGASVRMSLTLGDVAIGVVGPTANPALAFVGSSVNLGARLLKAVPPGGIAASAEVVAALGNEAPALAGQFRLVDPAFEIPGAEGVTVAVYAADEASRVAA
jgi:adenylate cyclase